MNAKRIVILAAALLLLLAAVPPATAQTEYCSDITRNTSWGPDKTHVVGDGCTVNVRGSTLTLLPGALIQMGEGANLVFQDGSELVAQSNANAAIRILANSRDEPPGYWGQIRFEPGAKASVIKGVLATGNVIVPVLIRSGGRDGVAMVDVRNEKVEMDWALLQRSAGPPLAFAPHALGPSLDAPGQSTVGQACQRVQLTENETPGIQVHAEAPVDIETSTIWHHFCVPYLVDDEILVAGLEAPVFKLNVGVEMRFGPNGGIVAGVDEMNPGELDASGTVADPITFSGQTETPGAWRSIVITEHGGASALYNARIEYGGSGDEPMVTVLSRDATALGLVFRHAKAVPLRIAAQAVSSFTSSLVLVEATDEPPFSDNGVQAVEVLSASAPVLRSNSAWGDLGVPFRLDGPLVIAGPTAPRLAIGLGAHLVFPEDAALTVGSRSEGPGELEIVGLAERPVILSGAGGTAGSWRGVRVTDDARVARIDHAVIEHGGSDGPMVQWGRAGGDVTRVTFRNAAGYPIAVPISYAHDVVLAPEVPDVDEGEDLRNTFEGNGTDRVLLNVDRAYTISLSEWNDPGAPVEFDDSLLVSSPTQPLLELGPGLELRFRAGDGMRLGDGNTGRAALLVALEDESDAEVSLAPVDPEAGWAGLRVDEGSSLRASGGLSVTDVATGSVGIDIVNGSADLSDVTLSGNGGGTGLRATGDESDVTIEASFVRGLRIGLHTADGARLRVTRSVIEDNAEFGFRNDDETLCLTAPLVYWGHPDGPLDSSDAEDGCLNGANANPEGDAVSDDIDWWPYAVDTQWTPAGGLGPNPWKAFCPFLSR